MAGKHRSIQYFPLAISLTDGQRRRLETAARCSGANFETFMINTLMAAVESIEASERRERQLVILLLRGFSWEAISKKMKMPVRSLRRAGKILAAKWEGAA